MHTLKEFTNVKNKILETYDKLAEFKLLSIKDYNIDTIKKWKEELEKEEFIVSFCGQIKAGKSTLLNALIFRKPVLPYKATPHTAKITIIKYGDKPLFKARFYSDSEWKNLISILNKQKESKDGKTLYDQLKKDIDKRKEKYGITPETVLNKEETENNLENLNDFCGEDGKYTPFIKNVTIYYNNPILKDLIIVDTPGTNDPNPLRSKETLEWVKRSNAVVYIAHAGQPFNEYDITFIDEYLLTVPSNLIIFAINKIDGETINTENSNNHIYQIQEWVEEVRKNERLQKRNIMQDSNSIVYVSAIGGLIDRMLKDCAQKSIDPENCIPENLKNNAEELYENGYLSEKLHGLPKLEGVIEKKLIDTKGLNILCSHKSNIEGVIEKNIREIKLQIETNKGKLESLNIEQSQLDDKIKELNNEKQKIQLFIVNLNREIEESMNEFMNKFKDEMKKKRKSAQNYFENELEKLGSKNYCSYESIPGETAYILKNIIEDQLSLYKAFKPLFGEAENMVNKLYNEIFYQPFIPDHLKKIFPVNTIIFYTEKMIEEEIDKEMEKTYKLIEKDKEKNKTLIGKTIGTVLWSIGIKFIDEGDRDELIKKIHLRSQKIFDKITKEAVERVKDKIIEELQKILNPIIKEAEKYNTEKGVILENLKKNYIDRKLEKEKTETQIESLKNKLEKLEKLKENILSEIEIPGC